MHTVLSTLLFTALHIGLKLPDFNEEI